MPENKTAIKYYDIGLNLFCRQFPDPEKVIQDKMIAMWALVHGLAAIVTMPNIEFDDNWEKRIEEIIKSISIPY